MNNIRVLEKTKNLIVSLFILISIFSFLGITKTLTSGYHFQDDHEIIRIKNDLKTGTIPGVSKKWIKEDLNIRFRPMYYIHRVVETKLFGSDYFLWSVYTGFLAFIALISFYFAMRNFGFPLWESLLFLIISFVGAQMAVWWRLGPNETIGIVFLGLSFFFMSRTIIGKNYILNTTLFCIFLIFSSLSKESFIIIIPGMIAFKILNEKRVLKITLKKTISKNLLLIIPFSVMIFEIYVIKFQVGTNNIGYSGLDTNIADMFSGVISIVKRFLNKDLLLSLAVIVPISGYLAFKRLFSIRSLLVPFILFLFIVIPNLILYAKYGLLWERYLLPSSVGLAFFVVSFVKEMKIWWLRWILIVLIFIYIFPNFKDSYRNAVKFAEEGRALKSLIAGIDGNNKGTPVLVVVDPATFYEQSVSLKTYLKYESNIDIYACAVIKNYTDEYLKQLSKGWYSYFKGKTHDDLKTMPGLIVFLDKSLQPDFFVFSKMDSSMYKNIISKGSPHSLMVNMN